METEQIRPPSQERPPWLDPGAEQELRDEADDFEDELIAEMRRRGKIEDL